MRVTLRKNKLKNDRTSLYLQIYHDRKTTYEFLKLYLEKSNSIQKRKQNKETLELAETIRSKRQIELQNGTYGVRSSKKVDNDFIKYFEKLTEQRRENGINFTHWWSTYKQLKKYQKKKLTFSEVNEHWLEGFKVYLLNNFNQNTAHSYFNKIKASLHQASRDKLIYHNPVVNVKSPKMIDSNREYLTIEEIRLLSNTECRCKVLKKAFLFSCLTGLRWSDINKLTWRQISHVNNNEYNLVVKQQKTNQIINLPLTEQSLEMIDWNIDMKKSEERVFKGLNYSSEMNIRLCQWVLKAKITKHITFHCARHTHATLLLANGIDIYTVSKLLGHREVRTTQIYTKVMDESKRKAVEMLPKI